DFSKSTGRILKSKTIVDAGSNEGVYVISDDEDVCPTSLEGVHFSSSSINAFERKLRISLFFCFAEYTSEIPKIVTKCSHHFHLGCIFEWMERSENCPVC